MLKFILRRLATAVVLLVVVRFFVFLLLELTPGDAAVTIAGENATPQQIAETRARLGLDDPVLVRYGEWLLHAIQGDLGTSLYSSESVLNIIAARLPVTASLALVSLLLVLLIGLPIGMLAAVRANSWIDRALSAFTSLSMALPPFVTGLALVLVFGVTLAWLPATGYTSLADGGLGGWLDHLILPAIAVAAISTAELARQTRGALVDVLGADYIRTTRAKGLGWRKVVGKHALKNAGVPIVTIFGIQVSRVLAGAVTVEFVFALPGFGSLAVSSVNERDLPVILGVVLVSALVVLIANVIVDLSYGYFNPRVRS